MKTKVTVMDSGFGRTAILFFLMVAGILFMLHSWTAAAAQYASFPFSPVLFGQMTWVAVAVSATVSLMRRDPGILFASVGLMYFAASAAIGPGGGLRAVAAGLFCLTAWCGSHIFFDERGFAKVRGATGAFTRWKLCKSLRRAAGREALGISPDDGSLGLWNRALESASLAKTAFAAAQSMGAEGLEGSEGRVDGLLGSVAANLCRETRIREFLRAESGRRRVTMGELALAGAVAQPRSRVADGLVESREDTRRKLADRAARHRVSTLGIIAALDSLRYSATLCGQEGSGDIGAIEREALAGAAELDDEVRCLAGEMGLLEA